MNSNIWFPYKRRSDCSPGCKLFCFHHAGGDSNIFRDWIDLDKSIEVIPVEIPGRRKRIGEECRTDFAKLIDEIAIEVISNAKSDKIFIYGHSLGAILAFHLVGILENGYSKEVEGLFVAGREAPTDEDPSPYRTSMGINALKSELLRIGDTPKQLLDNEPFMDFYMPIVYSDYRLAEDYSYDGEIVNCPIYAMCGKNDVLTDFDIMKNWQQVTQKSFVLKEFEGGHFFAYQESSKAVKNFVIKHIRDSVQHDIYI